MKIFHIVNKNTWTQAKKAGIYEPPTLIEPGAKGRFIHFSRSEQILEVANKFYKGQKDLIILRVNVAKLTSELIEEPPFEAPWATIKFPHLYGPLNLEAVEAEIPFKPEADGSFKLPKLF